MKPFPKKLLEGRHTKSCFNLGDLQCKADSQKGTETFTCSTDFSVNCELSCSRKSTIDENILPSKITTTNADKKAKERKYKEFYKTEICKAFASENKCEFGASCTFAHGEKELKQRKVSIKYRTKDCDKFNLAGYCQYGPRCQYKHFDEKKESDKVRLDLVLKGLPFVTFSDCRKSLLDSIIFKFV